MGYFTNYEISANTEDGQVFNAIRELYEGLFKDSAHIYNGHITAIGSDSVKWYDHASDLKKLSVKYHTVKFVLEGVGEDQGDLWQKIFLGGKMKYLEPEIVWPSEEEIEKMEWL